MIFALSILSPLAWSHGTGQHVLGTVTAIDVKHIEVKTPKGTVEVQINKQTRFKEKGNPKGNNLPAVGDRVVIEPNYSCETCALCREGNRNLCLSRTSIWIPTPA